MKYALLLMLALFIGAYTYYYWPQPQNDVKISYMMTHGSGVVTEKGLLTANHVMNRWHGGPIKVQTPDGQKSTIEEIIARGSKSHGAERDDWILFEHDLDLPAVKVYCGPLRVGQKIHHVGYGLTSNFAVRYESSGRILALNLKESMIPIRDIDTDKYSGWVVTDMGVSGGNSGGPIYDRRGRLIGILTAFLNYQSDKTTHSLFIRPPEILCDEQSTERGHLANRKP